MNQRIPGYLADPPRGGEEARADELRGEIEQLLNKNPEIYAYASARLFVELNRISQRQRYAIT